MMSWKMQTAANEYGPEKTLKASNKIIIKVF
jgi:hypothetical protein